MIDSLRRKVFWSILLSAAGVLLAILLAIRRRSGAPAPCAPAGGTALT